MYYYLPIYFDQSYLITLGNPIFILISTLFLVIPIIIVTVYIFKVPTQDGYELVVSSKPISRNQIFWTKVIVVISYILITSSAACCVSIGTQWSTFDIAGIYKSLILGSFVGTFINSFFWFSITLVVSFFISKMLTMFFVIGSKFVLVLLSVILSATSSTNVMQKGEIDGYRMNVISLQSNVDSENEINYFRGAITEKKMGQPITENTKVIGNITIKHLVNDFSNFNSKFWSRYDKEKQQILTNSLDLDFQLSNFFNYYSSSLWNSYDWQRINQVLHWDKVAGRNYIYKFSTLNLQKLEEYKDFKTIKLNLNKETNTFNGPNYYLQNFGYSMLHFPSTKKRILSNNILESNHSGIEKIDINPNEIYIPIISKQGTKHYWKLSKFDNLLDFTNFLYSDKTCAFLNECFKNFNEKQMRLSNLYYSGVYYSIFASYLYEKYNFDFNDSKSLKQFVDCLSTWVVQFQYWNWLLLEDMNLNLRNYPKSSWTPKVLRMIISMLSNGDAGYSYRNNCESWISIFIGNCEDFYSRLLNLNTQLNNNSKGWYLYVPPLSIMFKDNLATLSNYELQPWTNMDYSFIVWFSISSILTLVGLRLYSRKDLL